MELGAKLDTLSAKLERLKASIQTEEATKNAFIMPFIHSVLGYDVFNPAEVAPEFVTDVGTKKGEKVDYAILKNGQVQILIECKKIKDSLDFNCVSQLYRYFSVTTARIAILTNGQIYKFFTDLDSPNKMDDRPFLVLDLLDIDDNVIAELTKLTKPAFDLESVISAAGELKYVSLLKRAIANEFNQPDDNFSKLLICKVYDGVITQKVRDHFAPLISKSLKQFINDRINERLKTAISSPLVKQIEENSQSYGTKAELTNNADKDQITSAEEEIDGFNIVRAIIRSEVDVKRVWPRDTLSYFSVLLDDNNRKPICRLHFNRKQKYLGLFNKNKKEIRHKIDSLDDLFKFADQLKQTVHFYD